MMRLPVEFQDLRRSAPVAAPVLLLLGLLAWDWGLHRPAGERVVRLAREAEQAGISIRPVLHPTLMPPSVRTLLAANSIEQSKLVELRRSGGLAADLLRTASDLSGRHGIRVLSTEPGQSVTSGGETIVRAHLRASGSYADFVRFLDALSRGDRLIAVDQFSLLPGSGGDLVLDLRISRLVVMSAPAPGGRP